MFSPRFFLNRKACILQPFLLFFFQHPTWAELNWLVRLGYHPACGAWKKWSGLWGQGDGRAMDGSMAGQWAGDKRSRTSVQRWARLQCSGAGGAQIAQGGSSGWQRHCSTGGDWDQDLRVAQDPGEMKGSGDLGRALNHLDKQECNFCNRKVKWLLPVRTTGKLFAWLSVRL